MTAPARAGRVLMAALVIIAAITIAIRPSPPAAEARPRPPPMPAYFIPPHP